VSRRLFVALTPPDAVRAEVERAAGHLRRALPHARARYADAASTHLTLVFLGQVAEADVHAVRRATLAAASTTRRFASRTAALGAFPNPGRPSVLWLGLEDDGGLADLQGTLVEALAGHSADSGRQRFVPHLTLARVNTRRGIDRDQMAAALATFEPAAVPWPVADVVLFESELRREGARHTPLLTASLGQPKARPEAGERDG
jgi:RNA 2',3'-cyclic 3'-phosphodiesterase